MQGRDNEPGSPSLWEHFKSHTQYKFEIAQPQLENASMRLLECEDGHSQVRSILKKMTLGPGASLTDNNFQFLSASSGVSYTGYGEGHGVANSFLKV